MRGKARWTIFLIFVIWGCIICWWVRVARGGQESFIRILTPCVIQRNDDAGSVQPLLLSSFLQEPSTITKGMEEFFEVKGNEDIEDIDLIHHNYIHHTNHSTRSPFIKITQIQTKTAHKRWIPSPTTTQTNKTAPSIVTLNIKALTLTRRLPLPPPI